MSVRGVFLHSSERRAAVVTLAILAVVASIVATPADAEDAPAESGASDRHSTAGTDTLVVRWNSMGLEAVRRSTMGPPMIARALAVLHTCIYDAWAVYDPVAVGTRLDDAPRLPPGERTVRNKNAAISYAAHHAAVDLWPRSKSMFDEFMRERGYPPDRRTTLAGTVGIGACEAVLEYRHSDGSNQFGDLGDGVPYTDYTDYQPVNEPMVVSEPLDPATVNDPGRWQPLVHPDRAGSTKVQKYIAPHWAEVTPFALTSWDQFSASGDPARFGSAEYVEQAQELIDITAGLNERRKAIAEYWADGPNSEQPPGHWSLFGQMVSRRDQHSVDQDVKMFFALTNAVFDASIACWGQKRDNDYVRPITAIRYLYRDEMVKSWPRAGIGPELIDGATWTPYQPTWFPSPPFAEYVSGHSAFSAAGAEVLRQFTGSDRFGGTATIPAGSSNVEPGRSPRSEVTLSWSTFSEASDEAGISRRYGGIHFKAADLEGRQMGRSIGQNTWAKAQRLFTGGST